MLDNATPVDWRFAMKRAIRSSDGLRAALGLEKQMFSQGRPETAGSEPVRLSRTPEYAGTIQSESNFPTFVPLEFLSRIQPGDPSDPLLRQVMPIEAEDLEVDGYGGDPVGDLLVMPEVGVLHKYHGRVLLVSTGACGVHCRYCFRREFPYSDASVSGQSWDPFIRYLESNTDIQEVLLSGGDPLTLVDEKLQELVDALTPIRHVRRIRVHTRMPVVIPQRVTPSLIDLFASSRFATWFVIHANHPNELDADVLSRVGKLIDAGIPVLNQAVLLRGVNDSADILVDLCTRLVDHRIQPYYLHQLDRVRGASHFEVPIAEGLGIMKLLRQRLPGYAVPDYVIEQSGTTSKTPLV